MGTLQPRYCIVESRSIKTFQSRMQVAIFKPTNGKYGILEGVLKSAIIEENDIIYTSSKVDRRNTCCSSVGNQVWSQYYLIYG